jgi:glutamine amidotransferase
VVTGDPDALRRADGVVLPGVGAFAAAAASLKQTGLGDAVRDVIQAGKPYLGLCLGLQLLFEEGEEHGITSGLGLLPGRVTRFPKRDASGAPLRVPHIGWNEVRYRGEHPMLARLAPRELYYFVHPIARSPRGSATWWAGSIRRRARRGGRSREFSPQFHPRRARRPASVCSTPTPPGSRRSGERLRADPGHRHPRWALRAARAGRL